MNAGKAVIVSDRVGCWPDLVQPGLNGCVFPAGDEHALAAAISATLSNPGRLYCMGQASRGLIGKWSFDEDLQGIKAALTHLTNQSLP